MADGFTAEAVLARLHTSRFGRPLTVAAQTASTNSDLRQMAADGAPEGTTCIALTQHGGRGRRGRDFFSPDGGLYLSLLLRPAAAVNTETVTSWAAVAAARAIERLCPVDVGIKWVNDLYVQGRKVCGILAEGELSPAGRLESIILGFGINVARQEMPPELTAVATTLGNHCPPPERAALAAALLEEWEAAYAALCRGEFPEECRTRSIVLGREVTVVRGGDTFPATAVAITDEGHLLVRSPRGEEALSSGEVSLRL